MNAIVINAFRADGSVMNLADLQVADVDFGRMGNSLSKIARFNGIYECPAYSVAQHSVMGADALYRETGNQIVAGYFVLHDGHEYIVGDQTRPAVRLIAHHLSQLSGGTSGMVHAAVAAMKASIDAVILRAARLPALSEFPDYERLVRDMDERMLRAEGIALFGPRAAEHLPAADRPRPKLAGAVRPWGPARAEEAFLDRLDRYLGIRVRR